MNDTVLWSVDRRGVATVTLNRPQVNNAYNGDLIAGLHAAMDALGGEPSLRIVVLKGNGRHFQAGADLAWISGVATQSPRENEAVSRLTAEAVRRLDTCPVPTLALIQGGCFGGGTGIAAACVTDDFEWRLNAGGTPAGRVLKGKDDLRTYFGDKSKAHREARYSEARIHRAGDKLFGTFRVTGVDHAGRAFDRYGIDLYEVKDGKIALKDSYLKAE